MIMANQCYSYRFNHLLYIDNSSSGGNILTSQIFAGSLCTYEPEWSHCREAASTDRMNTYVFMMSCHPDIVNKL